jgi:hypothetical protein
MVKYPFIFTVIPNLLGGHDIVINPEGLTDRIYPGYGDPEWDWKLLEEGLKAARLRQEHPDGLFFENSWVIENGARPVAEARKIMIAAGFQESAEFDKTVMDDDIARAESLRIRSSTDCEDYIALVKKKYEKT